MSNAEFLLAVQLEQAGIPFEREYRFAPPRRWRADFRTYWLLIEIEGGIGGVSRHSTYTGFTNDCIKYNAAAEKGFVVLRYTSKMVNEGEAIEQVTRILDANLPKNWRNRRAA